jgi:CRP-like cAMP-binding protein
MSAIPQKAADCRNLLLSLLPDQDYGSIIKHLELISTPLHFVVFERGKPINYAYFPCSGEHSILATMEDGSTAEVGTVGYEGFSTVDLLMGSDIATETTVCQIPGEAVRMPAARFRELTADDTPLRRILMRYLQAYLNQISQSVACNSLHGLEQRFARWILMSHDRVHQNEFELTQEYIASMLGVARPSVSLAARTFQQAGLIKYNRGVISVLDRRGLEEAACECYGVIRRNFERSLGKGFG